MCCSVMKKEEYKTVLILMTISSVTGADRTQCTGQPGLVVLKRLRNRYVLDILLWEQVDAETFNVCTTVINTKLLLIG